MKLKQLGKLCELFPDASIEILNRSTIALLDKNGICFAHIIVTKDSVTVTFQNDYEHFDQVERRLRSQGITLFDQQVASEVKRELSE